MKSQRLAYTCKITNRTWRFCKKQKQVKEQPSHARLLLTVHNQLKGFQSTNAVFSSDVSVIVSASRIESQNTMMKSTQTTSSNQVSRPHYCGLMFSKISDDCASIQGNLSKLLLQRDISVLNVDIRNTCSS